MVDHGDKLINSCVANFAIRCYCTVLSSEYTCFVMILENLDIRIWFQAKKKYLHVKSLF